ncbi:MAG: DUF3313 family protein [Planctomycetota bacterium]
MTRPFALVATSLTALTVLAACRGGGALNDDPYRQGRVEALMDSGPKVDRADGADFSKFDAVLVADVTVNPEATQGDDVSAEQLDKLRADFQSRLADAFAAGRTVRTGNGAAGAGTLVVNAEIVRAVPNKPARNLAPQTQLTRTGYGYAAVRLTMVDGATGATLLTMTDTQSTQRFGTAKLSEWGTVEKAFSTWAEEAAKLAK